MLKHVNENNFENEVLKKDRLILVDFYADWCRPCQMLASILEKMVQEETDFDIVKVNIDNSQMLAMQYQIMTIPTMILFKNGNYIDSMIGFVNEQTIKNTINKYLK